MLASPIPELESPLAISEPISEEEAKVIVEKVAQRLLLLGASTKPGISKETSFAQKLSELQGQKDNNAEVDVSSTETIAPAKSDANEEPLHKAILSRLDQAARGVVESRSETGKHVPVLLLSLKEWEALVQECVRRLFFTSLI